MIEFLKTLVLEASKLINTDFKVKQKGNDFDLVTNLDLEIEKYIISKIKESYPDYDIVSEEFNNCNEITNNCFTIDPIDGTVNFANGIPIWGIQVACIENGKIVASVIYLPKLGELYYADNTGAYLNDSKISVKDAHLNNVMCILDVDNIAKIYNKTVKITRNTRVYNSMCVSLGYLASGKVHAVIYNVGKAWDYVPGLYICEKAGAYIKKVGEYTVITSSKEFLNKLEENL